MFPPLIKGPTPPFSNVPIEPQNFQPSQFPITNISLGQMTTVTMGNSTNNVAPNYVIAQLVRLLIPFGYGSRELNEQTGFVVSIPTANQVTLNINSSNATPFVAANLKQIPQIVAVGEPNNGIISSTGRSVPTTNIPGSFINIS